MLAEQLSATADGNLVELNLDSVFFKIACEGELIDGAPLDAGEAGLAYRRFLTLHLRHPGRTLVPSAVIDLVWHYHILDTREYIADCERLFGSYLHHDPYFGIEGEESRRENEAAWEDTKQLWQEEFGEPMIGRAHRCSVKDCR